MNFSTRTKKFNIDDNFNIYDLNVNSGEHRLIRDGSEDQPDITYKYPNNELSKIIHED